MDRNSGRSFDKQSYESLRRPHTVQPGGHGVAGGGGGSFAATSLSINAPEFVPRSTFSTNNSVNHLHGNEFPQLPPPNSHHHHGGGAGLPSGMNRLSIHERQQHQGQQPKHHHSNHNQHQHQQYYQHNNHQHHSGPRQHHQQQHHHQQQQQLQHQHSVQNRLNKFNNSTNAQDSSQAQATQSEEEGYALNFIEYIINCLSENPGDYDTLAGRVTSIFEQFKNNEYVLCITMETIFKRSIEEQNFRYMGAKLYGLLDMLDLRENSLFRTLLNQKLTYHQSELLEYMQNEQAKVRGTTLFLAELYMQLRNEVGRLKEIAQNIIFSINQLLQKASPENIKCICLALKLSGYYLEIDCPAEMMGIIQTLQGTMNACDVSTNRVLENVLDLQKKKWGRKAETPESLALQQKSQEPVRISDEPVFYGPDGQVLTEEESSFLTSNAEGNGESQSDDELNPVMDEEAEEAYMEFLKSTNQKI